MNIPALTHIPTLLRKGEHLIGQHAPTLLTAGGVVGTVVTALLTNKAAMQAARDIDEVEEARAQDPDISVNDIDLSKKEKSLLVWKLYMPAAGVGALSCAAIIGANHVSAKRLAAVAAAYSIGERNFTEYKEKVEKHFGATKEQKVRDEIAQDRVAANPAGAQIIMGAGKHLWYDDYSGRYFKSTMEEMQSLRNEMNDTMLRADYICLSDYYGQIGLTKTGTSDSLGWRADGGLIEFEYTTTVAEDNTPCMVVTFQKSPRSGYDMAH